MKKKMPLILLADDDPDDQAIFLEAFAHQKENVAVRTVNSGKDLFDFLDAQPADDLPILILLDYNMPLITGPEILKQLRSHPSYGFIAKVVWSSSERTSDIEACKRSGADDYIKKPSTNQEMEDVVRRVEKIIFEQLTRSKTG